MKSIDIMKKVDEAIFINLEKFKGHEKFQEFLEVYNNWDDKNQEVFKTILTCFVVVFPLFITFIFYMTNSSTHSDLEVKKEIINAINAISHQNSQMTGISRKYLGSNINSQSDFSAQINNSLSGINLDTTKVTISNYESDEEDGLNRSTASIRFKDITSQNLIGLLKLVAITKKMRIEEIDIKKNQESNLLVGSMNVFHYSKIMNLDEDKDE